MDETRWLDPDEARAWRGLMRMSMVLEAQLGRALLDEAGLSNSDYAVLVSLSEAECHRLQMSELAGTILWSKSRLSHHVTRMEQRGLVARAECPTDGRAAYVVLSEAGLQAIEQAAPGHVGAVRRHFLDALTRSQVLALAEITETVTDHLGCPAASPARAETG